jgi:hypothetical protein
VGFVVDKVALGQVFSEYFGFTLPIFIPQISPQSASPIIRGWYNRPVVAAVPKVPPHEFKNKKTIGSFEFFSPPADTICFGNRDGKTVINRLQKYC